MELAGDMLAVDHFHRDDDGIRRRLRAFRQSVMPMMCRMWGIGGVWHTQRSTTVHTRCGAHAGCATHHGRHGRRSVRGGRVCVSGRAWSEWPVCVPRRPLPANISSPHFGRPSERRGAQDRQRRAARTRTQL
eukprot:6265560-Prymnesium_polylepis.4